MSAILLKYLTFEGGVFSYFQEQNKYKIRLFVQFSVCTKKLINIKVRTIDFCCKMYFLKNELERA